MHHSAALTKLQSAAGADVVYFTQANYNLQSQAGVCVSVQEIVKPIKRGNWLPDIKLTVARPQRLSRIVAQQPIRPMINKRVPTAMMTTAGISV